MNEDAQKAIDFARKIINAGVDHDNPLAIISREFLRTRSCLERMFLWQAEEVQELMPDTLSDEIHYVLGLAGRTQ
jgi:hypothetical protein